MQTTARVARGTPPSRPHHAAAGLAPALGLALAPLVALGFSRFAYALLLPAMQQEFGWSFAQAGSLNTANAAGYLAGALLAAPLARRLGALRSFTLAMGLSALTLGLSLLTAAFSLGQSLGPLLTGALSDATGSLTAGLWLGPLLLLAAAAVSLRQDPRTRVP